MAEAKAFKMIPHCTKDTITYEMDELIRCKDCKHGHKCINGRREPMVKCELMFDEWLHDFDWFCADGEREDSE